MSPYALAQFVVGGLNILVGVLVLARNYRRLQNVLFALFSFSLAGWVIGIGGFLASSDPDFAFIWAKVYYAFPLAIALTMPLFSVSFPLNQRPSSRVLFFTIGGFLALLTPLLFIETFLTQSLVYHGWGKEIVLNKTHYLLYSIYLLGGFLFGLTHLFFKNRGLRGFYRAQASFFFYGFLVTSSFGVLFNLIYPWVGNYRWIWLGPLFSNAFVVATGISIVRHRMFDIRGVVARSIAYLLALGVLLLLYGGVSTILTIYLADTFDSNFTLRVILVITTLSLTAVSYAPIKKRFDKVSNFLFYRDAYDAQVFLDEFNRTLVAKVDIKPLITDSAQVIEKNLKAQYCAIGIKETSFSPRRILGSVPHAFAENEIEIVRSITPHIKQRVLVTDELSESHDELKHILQKNDIAVMARLTTTLEYEIEGLGYIVLGPKKSGNPYNKQDIKIIEIIANELVIAVQNALRFEEIEKFTLTLQEKIDEATKQLKRSNEKLKQLDETKDEFISMASHQLRTPLTSVKGYLSMVLEGDAGEIKEMQRKLLDQAFVSSQRMVYLIADLLNVSRLRTGKFVIEPVMTNLADMVEGEVSQLKETAAGRGLELTYDKPDGFPGLYVDVTKLRQVIMNFTDNAIYYTPKGGHIKVKLEDKGESIELTVTDDGMGVPKSEQPHLFTKFYRAGNAKQARPDGTGLGLFMAKKVIVAQGGSIIFHSQQGKGSTFGFNLPKAKLKPPVTEQKPTQP